MCDSAESAPRLPSDKRRCLLNRFFDIRASSFASLCVSGVPGRMRSAGMVRMPAACQELVLVPRRHICAISGSFPGHERAGETVKHLRFRKTPTHLHVISGFGMTPMEGTFDLVTKSMGLESGWSSLGMFGAVYTTTCGCPSLALGQPTPFRTVNGWHCVCGCCMARVWIHPKRHTTLATRRPGALPLPALRRLRRRRCIERGHGVRELPAEPP